MIDLAGFGKTAVVTGCSSGIGLATTLLFLKHQYQVFGVDITAFDYKVLDVLDGGAYQERFHFHAADLAAPGAAEEAVSICVAEYGPRIDVLANVAGVMDNFAAADSFSDKEYDLVIAVNLTAPTKMMRAVLPFMKEKKRGSIVNVCSKASLSGAAAGMSYTASKHALLGATKHTAWRFHKEGIRCNAVMPGGVATGIQHSMKEECFDQAAFETIMPMHALHLNAGAPEISSADIANTILFLASDEARFINGAAVPVDNAWCVL